MSRSKRKLITFIGTGDYDECIYTGADNFESKPTRFIQTALFEMLRHEGEKIDEVYLFITKEAEEKNYFDNKTRKGGIPYKGLKNVWAEYFPEDVNKLKLVYISSNQGEEDQWRLFEQVFDVVEKKDALYFDITHSFRSVPMIALLVANFAKTIHGASIERLLYGNFEVLRNLGDLDAVPVAERKAPIVDITSMLKLLDWTTGVQSFLETGNPKQINQLTGDEVRKSGGDGQFVKIRDLSETLYGFNAALETSRGRIVHNIIPGLKENLKRAKEVSDEVMPQFSKLMSKIESKVELYSDDKIENMWVTIKWCVDHGLYQQAITLAREYIISVVLIRLEEKSLLPETKNDKELRDLRDEVSNLIQNILKPKKDFRFINEEKHRPIFEPVKQMVLSQEKSFNVFQRIVTYRNNMNHAEKAQEEIKYRTIQKNMPQIVESIKPIFFHH